MLQVEKAVLNESRGLEEYLSGVIGGIGATTARGIVEYFGAEYALEALRNKETMMLVSGIGEKKVATIVENWIRDGNDGRRQMILSLLQHFDLR